MTYSGSTPNTSPVVAVDAQPARIMPRLLGPTRNTAHMMQRPCMALVWRRAAHTVVAELTQTSRSVWRDRRAAAHAPIVPARPTRHVTVRGSVFAMGHHNQIFGAVIRPAIPARVAVVNVFVRSQPAAKHLFSYKPMFRYVSADMGVWMAGGPHEDIPIRAQRTRRSRSARVGTVTSFCGANGRDSEDNTTRLAGKIDGHRSLSLRCRPGRVPSAPGVLLPSMILLGRAT